jgi:ribosomal protein L11 methyltransferase
MLEVRHALSRDAEQFIVDLESREEVTEWMFEEDLSKQIWIYGYFEDEQSLLESWQILLNRFPEWQLPTVPQQRVIEEKDWQDSYRKFFSPRSFGRLHWVPGWQKETYPVPAGDVVLYLDPGLAFGTGEHETTRLCMEAFQHWHEQTGHKQLNSARVVDAGCGSGILALSALLLGYQHVLAFDNDPQSVEVSEENRRENDIPASWDLRLADLQSGLAGVTADCLMANIQADVLIRGAENLVRAVGAKGTLILSGILIREKEQVKQHFLAEYAKQGHSVSCAEKEDGEWCALVLYA